MELEEKNHWVVVNFDMLMKNKLLRVNVTTEKG